MGGNGAIGNLFESDLKILLKILEKIRQKLQIIRGNVKIMSKLSFESENSNSSTAVKILRRPYTAITKCQKSNLASKIASISQASAWEVNNFWSCFGFALLFAKRIIILHHKMHKNLRNRNLHSCTVKYVL